MTKAEMRTEVLAKLGLNDGDIDPDVIDSYLDHIYQNEVPDEVGNAAAEGFVNLSTVANQQDYDLSALGIKSVRRPIQIGNRRLSYYTHPVLFWSAYDPSIVTGQG